MKGILVFIK